MSDHSTDIVVIGAGIAGASAAALLSETHRVVLLEREEMPGYHSTGRSAALFSEIYGGPAIRALSRASHDFFYSPPPSFASAPLVKQRRALYIADEAQRGALEAFLANPDVRESVHPVDRQEALSLSPILRPERVVAAVIEPDAADIDVNTLHTGFLRDFARHGGRLVTHAEVSALIRRNGRWQVTTSAGVFDAATVVNAAGAWADRIAAMAGVAVREIQPLRRTALLIEPPPGMIVDPWPMTIDIDETFYFKADAGLLLVSPADETPVAACDVQPEELDIAIAIDRFEAATTLKVKRIRKKWAGLRSFSPDRAPVIGFDAQAPGFFWLAGQGGYGIQTAPAAAALTAALVRHEALPSNLSGFDTASVSPHRFHRSRETV